MKLTIHAARMGTAMLLAITLGACATHAGQNFDDAYAGQISPGQTTKADVRAKLGRPAVVFKKGDDDIWIYAYYEGGGLSNEFKNWFGQSDPTNRWGTQQKRLEIAFKGDTVKESQFKQEFPLPDPLEPAYR